MAELLSDLSDEIIFVDYNTPDDFPTFPEAIQDTLTERARDLLRIFRVRPRIHDQFKSKTPLMVLESIARNVAVRRSSPSSRWILSINTGVIPIPLRGASMTDVVRALPAGIYRAPRIEIPRTVWESFDRKAAGDIIRGVRQWGGAPRSNQIAPTAEDFQLILRGDLFESHGFDEGMLLEHHVGANIARRMCLKYGTVGDLGAEIRGYHCDHGRQVTPARGHEPVENDRRRFVDEIDRTDIAAQAQTWGCAGDMVEEVRLSSNSAGGYVQALRAAIGEPLAAPKIVYCTATAYNKGDYDPRHLMPFLADMFVSMPRCSNVAWYGARSETLRLFAIVWERLSFTGNIFVDQSVDDARGLTSTVRCVPTLTASAQADAFVFDFGGLPVEPHDMGTHKDPGGKLPSSFFRVVREEQARLASGLPLRRIIALNAINNVYEPLLQSFVAAALSPYATHMRHGLVLPADPLKQDWLALLAVGEAGIRTGHEIRTDPQKIGIVAYGPHKYLDEGAYRVSTEMKLLADDFGRPRNAPCVIVEVFSGFELLGVCCIRQGDFKDANHCFFFDMPESIAAQLNGVELRVRSVWLAEIVIRTLTVEPVLDSADRDDKSPAQAIHPLLRVADWLPFLNLGPLGRIDELGVQAQKGPQAFVVFGPYWPLPSGRYEMIAQIERPNGAPPEHVITADVLVGSRCVASATFAVDALPADKASKVRLARLPFEVHDSTTEGRRIETRLWSSGEIPFIIRSVEIRPLARR
jgi:hypothetical protein